MPLWKNTQHAFIAGQLDANVMGRQDMERYFKGATLLKNFLVKRQGCISKRRGTDLTADLGGLLGTTYDGTPIVPGKMRLVPVTAGDEGRYLILSGGSAYVASRAGVLTADRRHIRSIPPYVAEDEDGNPVAMGGRDDRRSEATPIDLIHRIGAGNYEVTRCETLQEAFDAAVDGDTLRFHDNYLLASTATLRSERFTPSDGVASTFAFSGSYWKMTRGGTTYTATASGRDILTANFDVGSVTATCSWSFSSTHANRSFTLGWTYPGWKLTAVDSAEASGAADALSVTFTIDGADVTATRASTSSAWTFSDGKAWTMAFASGKWTASRTVGSAGSSNRDINATSFAVSLGGETVTATRTWSFSDGGDWTANYHNSYWWLSNANYVSMSASGSWDVSTLTVAKRVRATRQQKQITVDFYGYKLTVYRQGSKISVVTPNTGITFTSSRPGAKVWCVSNANCMIFHCQTSSQTSGDANRIGTITFDGDIDWRMSGGFANCMINVQDCHAVVFKGGTFTDRSENGSSQGTMLQFLRCTSVSFLGGKFDGGLARGSLFLVNFANANLNVSGGEFLLERPGAASTIFKNSASNSSHVAIEGGKFTCASGSLTDGTLCVRGSTYFESDITIRRGEFSFAQMLDSISGNRADIIQFCSLESVQNEAYPSDGYYGIKVAGEGDYAYSGTLFGLNPYRIRIPYADEDLADLCIRQSGDTLFIAHRAYPPAKIYFDAYGLAYFEEISFDNTDVEPPVVDSAEMDGNEPKETTWPAEFANPPAWLDNSQKTAVADFKSACMALGTVTDAGYNGNQADGSDGSCSYACSYTCTSVSKNYVTGKKTTTVSVKSFTKSITQEETTSYTDGVPSGTSTRTITTPGSAENSASVSSAIVTRTVRYVATYVKDGRESRPSAPVAVYYDMPWANNTVVNVSVSKGVNPEEPDYYNIYKDNGSGYGLVGTVGIESAVGGIRGTANTYDLYVVDNTAESPRFYCAADYESRRGWPVGSLFSKLLSRSRDTVNTSPDGDICLICPPTKHDKGIQFDFEAMHGADFDRIEFMMDGRIFDKASGLAYLIYCQPRVNCYVDYTDTEGGTGSFSVLGTYPDCGMADVGPYAGVAGTPKIMVGLQRKTFTLPGGDTVQALSVGSGDSSEIINEMRRHVSIDIRTARPANCAKIRRVRLTFQTLFGYELFDGNQGCIRSVHFYKSDSTASAGMFQDDYINPDMTVTPPEDAQDPHFGGADEYPGCVGIYEQRLVFASTRTSPSTIWMSRIADLYNFTPHESIREDDALELTLAATEFPNINHLVMGRDLMLFGDGGEWLVSPVTGNALTYKTASAKLQSMVGSDRALQPLQLADETLFAERGGTCLRSINYNYSSDSYQSQDLSVIAQSVFRANPIVSMAYKQHPDSIVECVLKDGRVATLVYMKEQDVAAWSVQELGGGWKAREIVSPKCIVNGTTEMMLLVERGGVYQLWKVRDDDDTPVAASQVTLDGMHIETSAEPTGTDEEGVSLGDGRYAIGYPVESEFVSVRPEPERGQTVQMEIKNATESEVRVADATTFSVKPYGATSGWREVSLPVTRDGSGVVLASKDCKKLMTGSNNRDGRIHLKHVEPWPITILSVSTTYQVEYENGGDER